MTVHGAQCTVLSTQVRREHERIMYAYHVIMSLPVLVCHTHNESRRLLEVGMHNALLGKHR